MDKKYKYRANLILDKVEKFEIIKETPKQIVFNHKGRAVRVSKDSRYYSWNDTFDEAKEYLIAINKSKVDSLTSQLEHVINKLNKVMELKEVL